MPSTTRKTRLSFDRRVHANAGHVREQRHGAPTWYGFRIALVVASLALAPWTAWAQADAPPHRLIDQLRREHAHDVFRVTGSMGQFIGHAATIDSSGFTGLQPTAEGGQMSLGHAAIAWNRVSRVDRRGHFTKTGALLGALVGGAAGGAFGVEVSNGVESSATAGEGFAIGFAAAALPGAAIGALVGRFVRRWIKVFDRRVATIAERGGN